MSEGLRLPEKTLRKTYNGLEVAIVLGIVRVLLNVDLLLLVVNWCVDELE